MVQEGEASSAAQTNEASTSHVDESEAADSQPVAERDPSERYSRVHVVDELALFCSCKMSRLNSLLYVQFDIVLGRGAFKTVYKGFDEEEGIEVAWNQVRVNELVTSREER